MRAGSEPREVWLHTNRRALAVGIALALLFVVAGVCAAILGFQAAHLVWLAVVGMVCALAGLIAAMALGYQLTVPRLAYADGALLVYLSSAAPARVPIEIVEFFFLGQGSSLTPQTADAPGRAMTVVARLALSAPQWHERPTRAAWGEWREGYIIVRGTWCEPLSPAVIQRLNRRLAEVQRSHRATEEASA